MKSPHYSNFLWMPLFFFHTSLYHQVHATAMRTTVCIHIVLVDHLIRHVESRALTYFRHHFWKRNVCITGMCDMTLELILWRIHDCRTYIWQKVGPTLTLTHCKEYQRTIQCRSTYSHLSKHTFPDTPIMGLQFEWLTPVPPPSENASRFGWSIDKLTTWP